MFVGQAWLAAGAEVTPDDEHDAYAWWPADIAQWPDEADEPLRRMAALLDGARGMSLVVPDPQAPLVRPLDDLHVPADRLARPRAATEEMVFGFAHGIGWILM